MEGSMTDLLMLTLTIIFLMATVGLLSLCERVEG
jgi:hypothetical protein